MKNIIVLAVFILLVCLGCSDQEKELNESVKILGSWQRIEMFQGNGFENIIVENGKIFSFYTDGTFKSSIGKKCFEGDSVVNIVDGGVYTLEDKGETNLLTLYYDCDQISEWSYTHLFVNSNEMILVDLKKFCPEGCYDIYKKVPHPSVE